MSIRYSGSIALMCSSDHEQATRTEALPAPIRARYLRARDHASDEREAYVRSVFGDVVCFPFSDETTYALSRADADYDILIIDAADPTRIARYLRVNRALLRNVAKFAIMQDSSPPRRVRILAAGCDDVLDGTRISAEEGRMRVAAVMHRYLACWDNWNKGRRFASDMAQFAAPNTLTPRELALLAALAEQPGKSISMQKLCRSVAPSDPAQFKRSLKFSISRLRSKLYPQWRIEAAADKGYALLCLEWGGAEADMSGEADLRSLPGKQAQWQDAPAAAFDRVRSAA